MQTNSVYATGSNESEFRLMQIVSSNSVASPSPLQRHVFFHTHFGTHGQKALDVRNANRPNDMASPQKDNTTIIVEPMWVGQNPGTLVDPGQLNRFLCSGCQPSMGHGWEGTDSTVMLGTGEIRWKPAPRPATTVWPRKLAGLRHG